MAARLAYRQMGMPEIDGRAHVMLIVRRARRMDDDNVIGGAKPVRDELFCRRKNGFGITEDDSARHLHLIGVRYETHRDYRGREELIVCVAAATP